MLKSRTMLKPAIRFTLVLILSTTPAVAESPDFRFGVIADVQHIELEPLSGDKPGRTSLDKLKSAVQDFNREDLAFVIHLGDFIDDDFRTFDLVLPVWNQLTAQTYHALGNHDYSVSPEQKTHVPGKLGLQQKHYDFSRNRWRFIVLDGNEISFHVHQEGSPEHRQAKEMFENLKKQGAVNALIFNGALGKTQLDWLDQKLDRACETNERVIVFSHYPVYPKHEMNLWNDKQVISILESHGCVFAYLNGHNHFGGYGVKNGIHYLTIQGVIASGEADAYAVVDIYEDKLVVRGRGIVPDRIMKAGATDIAEPPGGRYDFRATKEQLERNEDFRIGPIEQSQAYRMYVQRSNSELSKLIYLIDRFYDLGVVIIYDGLDYDTEFARRVARRYLQRNYRKENAKKWIAKHAYRSKHAGDVIRVRFPDGSDRHLRDVFTEELESLENLDPR